MGYEPKTDFEDGLKATIQWFKDNWNNIEKEAKFHSGIFSVVRDTGFGVTEASKKPIELMRIERK